MNRKPTRNDGDLFEQLTVALSELDKANAEIETMKDEWYSPAHMDAVQERTINPLRAENAKLTIELEQERKIDGHVILRIRMDAEAKIAEANRHYLLADSVIVELRAELEAVKSDRDRLVLEMHKQGPAITAVFDRGAWALMRKLFPEAIEREVLQGDKE